MTTAKIVGLPQVYTVDADPMSNASLVAAAKKMGAAPCERVEITFDDATGAGTRTYLVNPDLSLAYMAADRRAIPPRMRMGEAIRRFWLGGRQ